ncbi:DUF4255 domain-containing protein [Algoriphagus aestuarii]|nr:DUF4255 domain-containing protein [Algoriphagus aestuarii]
MIDTVLIHVRDLINQYFKNQHGFSENKVVISNLVELDGTSSMDVEDKVVMFLLGLGEEPALKNKNTRFGGMDGAGFQSKAPVLYLHLNIVFCSNFKNKKYIEGLNYLSQIISFFNRNRVIIPGNIPGLSKKVEKLTFELCPLSFDTISHVWSSIGAKLLPSSIYKVSFIAIDEAPISGYIPAITSSEDRSKN